MPRNIVYFDLETQKSAQEVGGWDKIAAMKMSIGVTYSTAESSYHIYQEHEVDDLIRELQRADLVVGFNLIRFDYTVLQAYSLFDFSQVPTLDLMLDIEAVLGHRLGLDAIAEASLGINKTAVGTDALKWWKEGRIREIAEYCCYDVKATKMVHEFGAREEKVFYVQSKTRLRREIPVKWSVS
jgi:DEAD/DEAH box helicase domain-containing protein